MSPHRDIQKKILGIIVEQLGISNRRVTIDTYFLRDLGADELDMIELAMAMEEEFNIEITDEEVETLKHVLDVVEMVKKKL